MQETEAPRYAARTTVLFGNGTDYVTQKEPIVLYKK